MTEIITGLLSGAVGGNVIGALIKKLNLGVLWNSVVGILGGGLGGTLLAKFGLVGGSDIVNGVAGGAAGGGVLMVIVGLLKNVLGKK